MYVYRFLDKNDEIIYIGKAKEINSRLNGHCHLKKDCYDSINRIEYIQLSNDNEARIYEIFYINKFEPKYNKEFNKGNKFGFELPEKEWLIWNGKIEYKKKKVFKEHNIKYDNSKFKNIKFSLNNVFVTNNIGNSLEFILPEISKLKKDIYLDGGHADEKEYCYNIDNLNIVKTYGGDICFEKEDIILCRFENNKRNMIYFEVASPISGHIELVIGHIQYQMLRIGINNSYELNKILEILNNCEWIDKYRYKIDLEESYTLGYVADYFSSSFLEVFEKEVVID